MNLTDAIKNAAKWYNKGRRANERSMRWRDLIADDIKQIQRTKGPGKGAWNPLRGMPGYGTLTKGKAIPGGFQTGPTPLGRQAVERLATPRTMAGAAPRALLLWGIMEGLFPRPTAKGTLDSLKINNEQKKAKN